MAKINTPLLVFTLIVCSTGCKKEDTPAPLPNATTTNVVNRADTLTLGFTGNYLVSGIFSMGGDDGGAEGNITSDTISISRLCNTQVIFNATFKELAATRACFSDSTNCMLAESQSGDTVNMPYFMKKGYYVFVQSADNAFRGAVGWTAYFPQNNSDSIYISIDNANCECHPFINLKGVRLR